MEVISINHLTKVYRNGKKALDDLSMSVQQGEIFTLLGENGAGKSTLINILTTFSIPTSGSISILGNDLCRESALIRQQIACVAQKITIDHHLSLMENLMFQSRLYKLDQDFAIKRMNELIQTFGLKDYIKRRPYTYSGGIKRRMDIAMGLITQPNILYLDEPTVGLDVESRNILWEIIGNIRKDHTSTIFMTTHDLDEAEALSDTICILKDGHQLVQDKPKNLRKFIRQNLIQVVLSTSENMEKLISVFSGLPFVLSIRTVENTIVMQVKDKKSDLLSIDKLLIEKSIPFQMIGIVEASLENVYLALTRTRREGE